ncbi:MAG: tol-pal system YbgF family protein [Phycisphaerales bacterium]
MAEPHQHGSDSKSAAAATGGPAPEQHSPASAGSAPALAAPAGPRPRLKWRVLAPALVLIAGGLLLVGGLIVAAKRAPVADPMTPLADARRAIEASEFQQAVEIINTKMLHAISAGKLSPEDQGEVMLTRARAIVGAQAKLGISHPENHRAIINDFAYAQERGAHLGTQDISDLADSHLALGEVDEAIALAKSLPDSEGSRRIAIFKRIVDANLKSEDLKFDQTLGLLSELLEGTGLDTDDRAWALARQTDLRLAAGFHEEAISRLLRALPRLEGLSPSRRGELLYLLGKAYFELEQFAAASSQLEAAETILPENDPLRGDALVLSGQILQASGHTERARDRFVSVKEQFANTPAIIPALLGLAETAAAEHDDDGAFASYRELFDRLKQEEGRRVGVTWPGAGQSLLERFSDRDAAGETRAALRFAQMSEEAYRNGGGPSAVPPEVLDALARTNRVIAETMLNDARNSESGRLPIDEVSPVTQAEAKRHLLDAGGYFHEHAQRILIKDVGAYRESLWNAADSFDLGGDSQNALMTFRQYVQDTPPDDPRHAEASFRYAQVLEGQRNFGGAAEEYAKLLEARGLSGSGVGPVADRSIVPLARCYFQDDVADNDRTGEQLLESAVSGATLEPESTIYRDALIELGEYLHRAGRYAPAIARLREASSRYPQHARINEINYKLADSCRLSAAQIDRELQDAMPQTRRAELERLRLERLTTALSIYQGVIQGVNAKDRRRVTHLERLARRNSMFYLGDCAFELRDYDAAIERYDAARQMFIDDPASLVAMVQIVNCYVAQKKWTEALTANERARQQLAALPKEAWDAPDLPMDQRHWQRWLDSTNLLDAQRRARAATDPGWD